MKTIDVRKQPRLSLGRTLEISVNGVRYRLFRSLVTMVVIAVAIAFMMNVVCEAISFRSIGRMAKNQTAAQQLASRWISRLTVQGTPAALLAELAENPDNAPLLEELRLMGGLTPDAATSFRDQALLAQRYLTFFADLGFAGRRVLVRDAAGTGVFERLRQPQAYQQFADGLKKMRSVTLPSDLPQLQAFLQTWPTLSEQLGRVLAGRQKAMDEVYQTLRDRPMLEALTDADGAFGEVLQRAGFSSFDSPTRAVVAQQARDLRVMRQLEAACLQPEMRKTVAAYLNVLPGDVNAGVLWELLLKRGNAAWFLGKLDANSPASGVPVEKAGDLARMRADAQSWERALRLTMESSGGFLGIGKRMTWLVLVSLLVCAVGISNAMLMSVTERFREIATLKCLGALDGFIMSLFVIEACMLGLVGGLLGALAGSMIGFGRMLGLFGGMLFTAFPFGPWGVALLLAVAVGAILAALAGVYPSYMAARLAPMEAMRIE